MLYNIAQEQIVNPFVGIKGVVFSTEYCTDECLRYAARAHGDMQATAVHIRGIFRVVFSPESLNDTFRVAWFDNSQTDGKLVTPRNKWMRFTIEKNINGDKFIFIS